MGAALPPPPLLPPLPPPTPAGALPFSLLQRVIVYPNYLDNRKTVAQGRRIPKELGKQGGVKCKAEHCLLLCCPTAAAPGTQAL